MSDGHWVGLPPGVTARRIGDEWVFEGAPEAPGCYSPRYVETVAVQRGRLPAFTITLADPAPTPPGFNRRARRARCSRR
jgi:hypothetical protein